jgi:hypothetical protein
MQWREGMEEEKRELTGLGKCRAVLLHKLLARGDPSSLCAALILTRNSRSRPDAAGPITAKRSVEDHPVVLEELEWVASARWPERAGCPPSIGYRRRGGDIRRDALPGEEPDGDARVVPKHCHGPNQYQGHARITFKGKECTTSLTREDTTAICVERCSKRVGLLRPDATTFVVRLLHCTIRAADQRPRNIERRRSSITWQRAANGRVKSSLVVRVVVHTLDDVDLARCRPIGAIGPERGPRPATRRHMHAVHDNKPASEAELCLNAHGIAIAGNLGRGVDPHDSIAIIVDGC